jgi:hypothetical protein
MAKLKAVLSKDDFDHLEDGAKSLYTEQDDGSFVLDVEDKDFKSKLSEFRSNNIKLAKELELARSQLDQFKGVDPTKYAEMSKKLDELEDKNLLDAGKIDELVATRTERMRQTYDGQVKALQEKWESEKRRADDRESSLSRVLIDNEVTSAIGRVGTVVKGGLPDIVSRARTMWRLEDGKPVPYDSEGKVKYGESGDSPMTMDEWAKSLLEEAPHLFERSGGSGSGGSGEAGSRGGSGNSKAIYSSDRRAFSRNLEEIAKGKVRVIPNR